MSTTITFHCGDVRDVMAAMPDGSVDLVVTSPPFWKLRSYLPSDHPDKWKELGSEATPAGFLDNLLTLTTEWRRLVVPTGSITGLAAALIDHRNIALTKHRISERVQILSEQVDGDTTTWTVDAGLPGTKGEADGQLSMFADGAA